MRSRFEWPRKVELKNRKAAGIQQAYSEISAVDFATVIVRRRHTSLRQITDSYMCDLVLGQTAAGAPYTFSHRTNSKKRNKTKNTFKKASGIVAKEAKRTVIAYGDAGLTGTKARGKNATLRCLDDNKRIVCRTSERSQREPSSYPPAIYQLKHCQLCPAANDRDIVWQRDINAALNIRSILVSYVESNYSILSRHPSLKRVSTSGGVQATSQPL
ncbi:hypothetical protein G6F67_007862 [Rhizopus microsporus]|nr:hypothetical protein G6F67_007862 [Rhizopus microsporus]